MSGTTTETLTRLLVDSANFQLQVALALFEEPVALDDSTLLAVLRARMRAAEKLREVAECAGGPCSEKHRCNSCKAMRAWDVIL